MRIRFAGTVIGILVTALLFFIMLVPPPARADTTQTPCDEWANFTKIMAYKFRDSGFPRGLVKDELKRVMSWNPDLVAGLAWVDFAYDHDKDDPVSVWELAYKECREKRGVQ